VVSNRLAYWQRLFYRYDVWGNLVSRRSGLSEQHYVYDALGRRTRKTVAYKGKRPQTTRFLWQGYRLLQEQRDNGTRRSWAYDPASPWTPLAAIEQADGGPQADIYWLHADLNSAPLEVTDADGHLRWSGQYDTFGRLKGQTIAGAALREGATYDQPLRYAGQYEDNESGLHYNLFRYYDPDSGRFTQQDPIGLAGGLNLYSYAPNPLGWIDPLGLSNKCMGVSSSGHHVPSVRKSKGRPFAVSRSDKTRPTLFPRGKNPEHDHWRLHDAERDFIGPRQGDFPGSDKELFDAYRKAYSGLDDIKVDVKSPNGTYNLGTDVTPSKAVDLIEVWLKGQGLM